MSGPTDFADDLFVLCGADTTSFQLVKDMLADFYIFLQLKQNLEKSTTFFVGIQNREKEVLHNCLPISEGVLPVKYLGVPLVTTRLHSHNCQILIDKITSRVKSWSHGILSYGGRAELLSSVLFSTQIYWSSIFVLPQKILKSVEAILRSFFWSGHELKKSGAKVKWSDVCPPKREGCLGFRYLKD